MSDLLTDKRVVRINLTIEDDLNLIVHAVKKVEHQLVLISVPEGNDILNSPVGLKALRNKTLDLGKRVILFVPNGPGFDLAKKAGFMVSASMDSISPSLWQQAINQYNEYKQTKAGMNSKKEKKPDTISLVSTLRDENPEVRAPGEIKKEEVGEEKDKIRGISGIDVSKLKGSSVKDFLGVPVEQPLPNNAAVLPSIKKTFSKKTFKIPGWLAFLFSAGVVAVFGVFIIYYLYFPKIRVELTVVSDKTTVSETVTATTEVTGFDQEKKMIQLLTEDIDQKGSVTITATGEGAEGTKATGIVSLNNSSTEPISVPVGTALTADSLKFVTSQAITVPAKVGSAMGYATVNVEASAFGEEYNIAAGKSFTVEGLPTLTGGNSAAFTGGTKRTFVVLSKKDVDDATDQLEKDLNSQSKSDLEFRNTEEGYVLVKDAIKNEIVDKPVVNPSVGTETNTAYLELKTKSTGVYYHKVSLDKLAENQLKVAYRTNKKINPQADITIENFTIKVSKVVVNKDGTLTLSYSAEGLATPKIQVEALRKNIAGKKWQEMLTEVTKIDTLAKSPNVHFYPDWMPAFLRYVPKEEGRIDVSVRVEEKTQ